MSDRIVSDAQNIKKLVREAEAIADESMIALARLKQAMLTARQNPDVEVVDGQRALMRLNQAETQALSVSTSLLRVHEELSALATIRMDDASGANTPVHASDTSLDVSRPEPQLVRA